jgi:adenylate cyclase
MHFWQRFTTWLGALPASRVTWALALAFCLWAVLDLFALRLSGGVANSTYDTMVRARFYAAAPDPRVVIVDIDEASLAQMAKEFGRWPWPRDTLATVLDFMEKQNPQAVAWDVLFSDADRLSPGGDKAFDEAAKRSAHSHFSVVRLPAEYDRQSKVTRDVLPGLWLGVAVPQSPLVNSLASTAGSQPAANMPGNTTPSFAPAAVAPAALLPVAQSTVALIPPVLPAVAASRLGYNNGYTDVDGVLRRYRMLETLSDGSQIQSMALSVANAVQASNTINSVASPAIFHWPGGLFDAKKEDALMLWRSKANHYPRVPFADVFSVAEGGKARSPMPSFAGKIVLIGSTASSLHDIHPTPLGAQHAGVDSLATAIDNAVNQRHLAELPRWLQALLAISLCMGMAWWVQRHGIGSLDASLLLLPGALLGISYLSLNGSPVFVDLHLAAGFALLFIALLRVWNGWRRNYWCGELAASMQPQGIMALRLALPAAGVGLDALIRTLELHAPQCRVLGGDATATWPAQLRWPELHQATAVAGPLPQLQHLRSNLLSRTAASQQRAALTGLTVAACSEPYAVQPGISRAAWAEHARSVCATAPPMPAADTMPAAHTVPSVSPAPGAPLASANPPASPAAKSS